MRFHQPGSEIWTDGRSLEEAAHAVTHMGVGAHPDDVEFIAYHGIEHCFARDDRAFCAVVCTDGGRSPRKDPAAALPGGDMRLLRRREQEAASKIGRYGVTAMLDYPSSAFKDAEYRRPNEDLAALLDLTRPEVVYTHNPADKHPTHVSVVARLLDAVRSLPADERPKVLLGCECWRDLDWVPDYKKVVLDVSGREHLAAALASCFDSQIGGGKRYDLAVLGRRRANATFLNSHAADEIPMATFALDLTHLVDEPNKGLFDLVAELLDELKEEVRKELSPWT